MSELSGPRVAVCLATFRRPAELDRILPVLVEQRAAACVNILPRIQSVYHWQGAVE